MTVGIVAAVAILTAIFLIKSRIQYVKLPVLPKLKDGTIDDICIIIPARNEEKNIAAAVRSFPGILTVVINDGSDDNTAELAKEAGAVVLDAPPLPNGLVGKPHACMFGAQSTESDWILFVDADTQYEPEFLVSLMQYARNERLDLVSVFLRQQFLTVSERIVLPYALALQFCGVSARNVNSIKSMDAIANGQCMLFRREVYDFLGGHRAVGRSPIDDVMLAYRAKRHRVRQRVLRAEHLGTVQAYEGYPALRRGYERNAARLVLVVNRVTRAQVVLASILLVAWLPLLLVLIWRQHLILAAAYGVLPFVLLWPWYGNAWAIFAPVAIYWFHLIGLSSLLASVHGRSAVWKGRKFVP